jgi:hypothetical protein
VSNGELSKELSFDAERFPRSNVAVGGVYFNTHASKVELKRRLRKIAERIGIDEQDYGYVFANDPYPAS